MRPLALAMTIGALMTLVCPASARAADTECYDVLLGWGPKGKNYAYRNYCRGTFEVDAVYLHRLGSTKKKKICGQANRRCPKGRAKLLNLPSLKKLKLVSSLTKRAGWKASAIRQGTRIHFYVAKGKKRVRVGSVKESALWSLKGVQWDPKGKYVAFRIRSATDDGQPANTNLYVFRIKKLK